MRILISNDDGINATGLRTLAQRLSAEPAHEVYVVAPDRERSATGHSLTLHKPLRVESVTLPGAMKAAWATTGTPSDCVKLAITELITDKIDMVISGINNGPNLGSEILYSGTVAAAMEGAFMDIPSLAVSQIYGQPKHFETAAEIVARLLQVFPKAHLSKHSLLNLNVPNLPLAEVKGLLVTEVGVRLYNDYFEKRVDPRGRVYYWLAGHAVEEHEVENSDTWAILNKYASLSPIAFNMTDRTTLKKLDALNELKILVHPGAQLVSGTATGERDSAHLPHEPK